MSAPFDGGQVPDTQVTDAQALFDRGDFRGAREAAARAGDKDEARALLARLAPDPWAARFGALALVALVVASIMYLR